jgi:hypothetical protein
MSKATQLARRHCQEPAPGEWLLIALQAQILSNEKVAHPVVSRGQLGSLLHKELCIGKGRNFPASKQHVISDYQGLTEWSDAPLVPAGSTNRPAILGILV